MGKLHVYVNGYMVLQAWISICLILNKLFFVLSCTRVNVSILLVYFQKL